MVKGDGPLGQRVVGPRGQRVVGPRGQRVVGPRPKGLEATWPRPFGWPPPSVGVEAGGGLEELHRHTWLGQAAGTATLAELVCRPAAVFSRPAAVFSRPTADAFGPGG